MGSDRDADQGPVVGYIVSRFPHFSETFIVREMTAVEECGLRIVPCALIRQRQAAVHAHARSWLPRVHWTGLRDGLLGSNIRAWRRQPRTCWQIWSQALRGNAGSLRFLARAAVVVPKAVLMADALRRAGACHVHAHYATHPALAAWVVHRLTGLSYSVTVHAHDIFTPSPMLPAKLGEARAVVAISEYNRSWIADNLGPAVAAKTYVVRCGVEPAAYQGNRGERDTAGPFLLLTCGSLQEYKGHRHLLQACALLTAAGMDLRCVVAGEGRLRPQLEAQVRALGLERVVDLVGVQDEQQVVQLLRRADCYVQPSVVAADGQMEGIPVALMEAMAACVPVVATELSGVPELVQDGRTGLLVPPADPEALARAVLQVARDRPAAARRAAVAHHHVRAQHDLYRSARALALLLQPVPAPPRPEEIPA